MPRRPQLKPLGQPKPVHVRTDDRGDPEFVRLPGKTARKVLQIRERWRIDDEWWRRPISRAYYAIVLDDGRVLTLYHDLLEEAWYVQKE
jgi:hypothetical protein